MAGYQNYGYPARHADADSFAPGNDLLMPGSEPKFMNFTILAGQNLLKGSVVGMVTASRKLKLCASAAGDGSQTPIGVIDRDLNAVDIDGSTPLDTKFDIIVSGAVFNPNALVLGAGMTQNVVQDALRALGNQFSTPGFSG